MLTAEIAIRAKIEISGETPGELRAEVEKVKQWLKARKASFPQVVLGDMTDEKGQLHIEIPERWGMFSDKGNSAIKRLAETMVASLRANSDRASAGSAFHAFFHSHYILSDNMTGCNEASDTAVRDEVWGFALSLSNHYEYNYDELDRIWEAARK